MGIEELLGRVTQAAGQKEEEQTRFVWSYGGSLPAVKGIQKALDSTPQAGRAGLAKELLDSYVSAAYKVQRKEQSEDIMRAKELFGPLLEAPYVDRIDRLMGTLTGDKRQFRIWYSPPGAISFRHVDSCGYGLLMDVDGPGAAAVAQDWMKDAIAARGDCGMTAYLGHRSPF